MTTEGPADVRGKQEDSNRTETATLPTEGARATEKGKSFEYVCPHCDQSVTSTIRTDQVDHRRTCGHRFRVREGRLCAKAYDYVCPACNGHVASNVVTGQIDNRTVCGNKFSVNDGVVDEKGLVYRCPFCNGSLRSDQDRANRPSTRVRQPVLCHGRCSQQDNTVSCAQLPGVLICCLVIAVMWAHCGHA